jgi:hypothetical protein
MRPPWWCGQLNINNTDYDADNPSPGNAAQCPGVNQPAIDQGVQVANPNYNDPVTGKGYSNDFSNDVWLEFHITIPSNYDPPAGQDWWKVAYNLKNSGSNAGSANDTTTWEVDSGNAPVHLIGEK